MQIIPVLDLLGGQVVRGVGGRREAYRPVRSVLTTSSEPRQVAVEAGTLAGVLAAAEERLAAEQRDEEEWLRQIVRVS